MGSVSQNRFAILTELQGGAHEGDGDPKLQRFTHRFLICYVLAPAVRASPAQGLPSEFLSPERYRMGRVPKIPLEF